jgi:hypothetical protein
MKKIFGGVLLSHTASHAVPSALKSLTSVFGMGTGVASSLSPPKKRCTLRECLNADSIGAIRMSNFSSLSFNCQLFCGQAARPISTSKLNTLLCLHTWPINLVVFEGSLVKHVSILKGYLISRWASRLDAFSGYPFRT